MIFLYKKKKKKKRKFLKRFNVQALMKQKKLLKLMKFMNQFY